MTASNPREPLVLVTSRSFGTGRADPEGLLRDAGLRVEHGTVDHNLRGLSARLSDAHAWIAGTAPIGRLHLKSAPHLRLIARYGTGTDNVDLDAAAEHGVLVSNTPAANAEAVAEHTLALLLAALRHVIDGHSALRHGESPRLVGRELGSLTVGLVGFGSVGRAVASRLRGLGTTVLVFDPAADPDTLAQAGVHGACLNALISNSDVVSLHRPASDRPVLDRRTIATMRPEAIVVNTARADLVEEQALADALHAGRVGGAALDVFSGPASPLCQAPRTVLTPHVAGHTSEAVDRMGTSAADEVVRVIVHRSSPRNQVAPVQSP